MTTEFTPILLRIKELVLNAAGNDGRTIPVDSFQSEEIIGSGPQRSQDDQARNVVWKPEFSLVAWDLTDNDRINENFTAAMYDMTMSFEVSYKAAPSVWEAERLIIEAKVMNNAHIIRRALSNPDNFDSSTTGLASGCLEFQSAGPARYDIERNYITLPMSFSGIVQLDFT